MKRKPNEDKEKPQQNRGPRRVVVFLLLAVVLGGGLAYGVLHFFGPLAETEAALPRPEPTEQVDLGEKVVNLANGGYGRYLRVRVVLEFPARKELIEEIKDKQPLITEKVLTLFRSKRAEEILPVKNQAEIKEELLRAINEDLVKGKATQVYFTDFLVQ